MDFSKTDDVHAFPAPPEPKTMRQTKYLDPEASHEKKCNFFENHIFAVFLGFFDWSKSKYSRFGRSGDVSVPTIDTQTVWKNSRPFDKVLKQKLTLVLFRDVAISTKTICI